MRKTDAAVFEFCFRMLFSPFVFVFVWPFVFAFGLPILFSNFVFAFGNMP